MRHSLLVALLASAVLVGLAFAAAAQDAPPHLPPGAAAIARHPAVQDAFAKCNGDVARFCAGVVPGGGRIVRCLIAAEPQLTPACRDGLARARAAVGG